MLVHRSRSASYDITKSEMNFFVTHFRYGGKKVSNYPRELIATLLRCRRCRHCHRCRCFVVVIAVVIVIVVVVVYVEASLSVAFMMPPKHFYNVVPFSMGKQM